MIAPHPNDLLPVGNPLNAVKDYLVGRGQFQIDVIDDVPIEDEFTIPGDACEKVLKNLISKISGAYV
jgi:hypothetical protein